MFGKKFLMTIKDIEMIFEIPYFNVAALFVFVLLIFPDSPRFPSSDFFFQEVRMGPLWGLVLYLMNLLVAPKD